jgi:hypothetical protein
MTKKHLGARLNAIKTFKSLNISISQDFFTLSPSQVCDLLEEADRMRYQKPKNANGSRARYFHARLQRHARLVDK